MILALCYGIFFFKQKTAYEMRISDWSSDVCSSDLVKIHSALLALALLGCKEAAAPPPLNAMEPGQPMPADALTIDFEAEATGAAPSGFSSAVNKGRPGAWRVERVVGAPSGPNAVVQTAADPPTLRIPVRVYKVLQHASVPLAVA